MKMATRKSTARHIAVAVLTLLFGLQAASPALAGPREQARRLHDRIAGVPPTEAVLAQMAADIQAGNATAAANRALANRNFYSVTLKNFIAPRTNRDQSVFVPLNDYTATVIGMIRDDVDFSTVLSADLLYVANTPGAPAYSPANNAVSTFSCAFSGTSSACRQASVASARKRSAARRNWSGSGTSSAS